MKQLSLQTFSSTTRKVSDTIYGFIVFPKQIWQFIDTPHFQRLRNIKQLGCLSFVFPSATHSRFQHCLGTGYLAQQYITTIINNHSKQYINPEVYQAYYSKSLEDSQGYKNVQEQAIFTVTLAGVLHDIGHGPYSHLFEGKIVNEVQGKKWSHQIASLYIIDAIYDYVLSFKSEIQQKDQISWLKNSKNRVKALIIGKISQLCYKQLPNGEYAFHAQRQVDNLQKGFTQIFKQQLKKRPWQFQIINNRLTGIDVDKFDYFRRDAYYLGAKNIFIDYELLINQTLVLEEKDNNQQERQKEYCERHRLCYPSKYSDLVYDIFSSRYKLFKTYYMNLKSNGIQSMVSDILNQAESYLQLKLACKQLLNGNCSKYINLTDFIIYKIEDAYNSIKESTDELKDELQGVIRAGKIIERLKRREIYDFVQEYCKDFSIDNICTYYKTKNLLNKMIKQQQLTNKDIVYYVSQRGFGLKDNNPFDQCRFYDKSCKKKEIINQKNSKKLTMLKQNCIIEISLAVYLREKIKFPNSQNIRKIQEEERRIGKKVKDIDSGFIDGQSGTLENRKQNELKCAEVKL